MSHQDKAHFPPVDPVSAGLRGQCPQCGQGKMFSGVLTISKRCGVCGLDYSFADAGDGPAVFVILIIGFLVVGLALWLMSLGAPIWLHFILWPPIIIVLSLLSLRWIKGVLVAQQFRTKASEGRLDKGE